MYAHETVEKTTRTVEKDGGCDDDDTPEMRRENDNRATVREGERIM